jgi:predicted RNA binding protein YcfA (HicA-like mRNA interferase family)
VLAGQHQDHETDGTLSSSGDGVRQRARVATRPGGRQADRFAIKRIEAAGWELARTRGSHRQYRHPDRPGLVTVAGKPSDTLHPKTWASIIRQAGLEDDDS